MIEEVFVQVANGVALLIEGLVVLVVAWGSLEAVAGAVRLTMTSSATFSDARREVWFRLAAWIVLALELALGADIIRSAIAPSWEAIGKLGAIAAIRTALNFFLMRDIAELNDRRRERENASD